MSYFLVGVILLGWGALVGRIGRKLGTILAVVPVLVWFGVLAWLTSTNTLDSAEGRGLASYLLVGLLAFLVGSNLTSRLGSPRRTGDKAD
ncbi:MAG: hypothetical protein LBE60_07660 [Microbacterium sp.]|jgi:purine-cytosine permease-like protein|uniref:hypothetical protein n=1 Tax=Microbacterium sp. TaxID=51671 RepID=UPI00282789F9|nr:hypothetical protein [Microbacterium sp.]MDR2321507.1 hypothetical protein [Microbacterium sp.]